MRKTTFGLSENVAIGIIYFLSFVSGIAFLVCEKEDKKIRFHAMQSTIIGIAICVVLSALGILGFVPILNILFGLIARILGSVFSLAIIVLAVLGFMGNDIRIPVVADIAESKI